MPHELHRRDASRNMARFYALAVVPGLFGEAGLCRTWGRIGARGGRSIVEWFETQDAAQARLEVLRRQKLRRGYQPAAVAP